MPDVTRIIEQTATESIYNDDWFLKDSATNGTTKILASKLKELLCGDYIADEWVAGETYTNGAIVSYEGKLYYNSTGASLTQSTFDANAWLEVKIDELLEKVIGSVGEKWRSIDTYCQDDLVVYGGRLYRCIKTASTQGTWVSNEWIEANAEYYFKKVREYIARYGFIPSREAVSSPYNKGDLILYGAPGDTTNSLYMRLNDTKYGDPTWIPENWLKVGNIGGALSKIYDDIEESSCDVQIKEQSIVDENRVADLTSLAAAGSASGAIATFTDGSDLSMPKLEVAIDPIQDLHGYDHPWVGGAGKNKFNCTATTQTKNQVTFTVNDDGTVSLSGTASATASVLIGYITLSAGTYILSGGVSDEIYLNIQYPVYYSKTSETQFTVESETTFAMFATVYQGVNATGKVFKPMIRLASVTDATFAPYSNICPISGWSAVDVTKCGKNLWGGAYNKYFPIHFNEDKVVIASADVPSEGAYPVQIAYYDKNKTLIDYWGLSTQYSAINNRVARSFTLPKESYYLRYKTQSSANYQIEFGETNSVYEPYNGQTYNIDLDGTRYGGTLDVVSGVMTVDREYVDMGTLNWTYRNGFFRTTDLNATIKKPANNYEKANAISSIYTVETWNTITNTDNGKFALSVGTADPLLVCNTSYTDATDFKTAMNGVQLVYELATPLTIQLTPTAVKSLLGMNNIWADTGDVLDAEYIRDATTIINSLIARIEALENQ